MPFDSSKAELEAALRELHAPAVELPSATQGEADALAAWERRHARGPSSSSSGSGRVASQLGLLELLGAYRFAVAAAFVLVISLAGACALPTSYEVPLGLSLEIRAAVGVSLPAKDIAMYVQSEGEAGEVDLMVREVMTDDELRTIMQIRLWDQSFVLGELPLALRESFPELADAEITETALEGEVEMAWGRRFAHETFDVALREADLEQAREQLLMRLHARGFDGDEVTVQVRDRGDGQREIEVRIEHEATELEEAMIDGFGPGFDWQVDPSAPERIELPVEGEILRLELRELEPKSRAGDSRR